VITCFSSLFAHCIASHALFTLFRHDCQRGERRYGASHQGQTINKWKEDNMFEAIKEFKAQKETAECERLSVRGIARA